MSDWLVDARRRLANMVGDEERVYALDTAAVQRLLDLARIAAHESGDRTNAPLASYLVGLAHGRHGDRALHDLVEGVAGSAGPEG
jgi:hypothetical protein